ncbi:hypothetical protein HPB52_014155 [Rhipicephalus sanguineus]|uniref:Uncharacterized protein n=1 Tax=Rhipicephalus sanguineus TaxID=34632 RepID=A0A9D4SX02_RHISA|nr:hypothetical protein HPB52_014155 [Rhipicephalus sanguineus]
MEDREGAPTAISGGKEVLRKDTLATASSEGNGQLSQYKVRFSLSEVASYCLPSLPCRCPCEYGVEFPSMCGICVCPSCGSCSSSCYYKVRPGEACPRCAPSEYCFGDSAQWQERPRYPSHHKEPGKNPMNVDSPEEPKNPKNPEKPTEAEKPKEPVKTH